MTPGNRASWGGPLIANYLQDGGHSWIRDKAIHWSGCIALDPRNSDQFWVVSGNGVFTAAKEAEGVKVIGCDVDQYDDGANGDSNIVLTSGLKVMHDTVYNVLNEVKDGSFKGANVTLTAADDATGFVSEEGRCQLTAEAIEKINAAQALLKEGKIVPAANFNGVTPETFTW